MEKYKEIAESLETCFAYLKEIEIKGSQSINMAMAMQNLVNGMNKFQEIFNEKKEEEK